MPLIPVSDGAGEVVAIGEGVTRAAIVDCDITQECNAKLVMTSDRLAGIVAGIDPNGVQFYAVGTACDGFTDWATTVQNLPETPIADEVQGLDMLYASGTTGRPKGIKWPLTGISKADFGAKDKAIVELVAGQTGTTALQEGLIAFCRARLSLVKCPHSIDFRADRPRTATGKLLKCQLRDDYWANPAQVQSK